MKKIVKYILSVFVLSVTAIIYYEFVYTPNNHHHYEDYHWNRTIEGYLFWSNYDTSFEYSWQGETVSNVINGPGILTEIRDGKEHTVATSSLYGSINLDSVRQTLDNSYGPQKFVGYQEHGLLQGFCVLFDDKDIIIGEFADGKPCGFAELYKEGHLYYSGKWDNGHIEGEGTLYQDNGQIVSGQWKNCQVDKSTIRIETPEGSFAGNLSDNKPSGIGTMKYSNGEKYNGEWEDGTWNGYGDFVSTAFSYSGSWKNSMPNGEGRISFQDESFYDGEWVDGQRCGQGDAGFLNGDSFSGEWDGDLMDGEGTYYFHDGSSYLGSWQEGLQNGYGVYQSNTFDYYGDWEEGWMNGQAHVEYSNGDIFEGSFVENQRYGEGIYQFADGKRYEGEFVDNVFNGLGIFSFTDGSYYEGEFLNGNICGDGTYYFIENGEPIAVTAEWDGTNSFPSVASFLFSNGDLYEGEIVDGKPTKNGTWYKYKNKSKVRVALESANDFYKLHEKSIEKVVLISSACLIVVSAAAASVASAGAATPALVAAANTLAAISSYAGTVATVVNTADIAMKVSSSAIDGDWKGVGREVAINMAFIVVPKGISSVVKAKAARKEVVKLSTSALNTTRRTSALVSKSTPLKKVVTVSRDEAGTLAKKFSDANKAALKKFSESSAGRKMIQKQMSKQFAKSKKIISKLGPSLGIDAKLEGKLLSQIEHDPELGRLIVDNPELNLKRWTNTQIKVDKSAINPIARNTQYAGKNFYFHPSLNKNIDNYLAKSGKFSNYSREELLALDKLFPEGIPYNKTGFPDFVAAGACKTDEVGKVIKIKMPDGHFTGARDKDFAIVREEFRKLYGYSADEYGYIWHHLEGEPASMVLVRTEVHECCKHTGGHAIEKARQLASSNK